MLSDKQKIERLNDLIEQSTKLANFFYTGIEEAVELRAFYRRYILAISQPEVVMGLRIVINEHFNWLESRVGFTTGMVNALKLAHQEMHNAD